MALCQDCHDVKHIMFIHDNGEQTRLLKHFMTVNRLTKQEAEEYLISVRHCQQKLNQRDWVVIFGDYNWEMPPLKTVQQRKAYLSHNRHGQYY